MTNQILAFQNFANAPNNPTVNSHYLVPFCFGRSKPEDGAILSSNRCVWHFKTHDGIRRWQVRALSCYSNKLTNQMQHFYKFITWRFVSLNMFRAPPRPSSGAYKCINSLWFYSWSVMVAALLVVVWPVMSSWWLAWSETKRQVINL